MSNIQENLVAKEDAHADTPMGHFIYMKIKQYKKLPK